MGDVLLAGVDTLAVGFGVSGYRLTEEEWAMLAAAKLEAQGTMFDSGGSPVTLRGQTFSVMPKGGKGYEYRLVNDDVTIQLAEVAKWGQVYPEIHITWRSAYLWSNGWQAAFIRVRDWVYGWAVVSGEKVSRADLCVDLKSDLPEVNIRGGEVVSYARDRSEFYQDKSDSNIVHHFKGLEETGYSFGKGNLKCRIYDKRAEIDHSNKTWFHPLWKKGGWNGQSPVTRVEFQARRGFLKSMQIDTVQELEMQLADLWKYFTTWLSLRYKTKDSNRRRWPVQVFWQIVCKAVPAFGVITGVSRIAQRKPRMDSLCRMARGVLVSIAALMQTAPGVGDGWDTESDALGAAGSVLDKVREWVLEDGFREAADRRAGLHALMSD